MKLERLTVRRGLCSRMLAEAELEDPMQRIDYVRSRFLARTALAVRPRHFQAFSRIRRETVARIAELDRPEDDDDQIQDWVDKTTAAVDRVETIPGADAAIAALQASGTPADPFYEANHAAAEYGLDNCSV